MNNITKYRHGLLAHICSSLSLLIKLFSSISRVDKQRNEPGMEVAYSCNFLAVSDSSVSVSDSSTCPDIETYKLMPRWHH